ncbi:MAG: fructose-6-phosphate aldolase [Flavobacteriaceae bacterium]|nr:fructose-6-phosphate aldolase [Flavobacteriaceae bacterium]
MYYLLKIKGKSQIPDYIQLRDSNFTLVAYFRQDRPERALIKCGLERFQNIILTKAEKLEYGKIEKIKLHD